MTKKDYQLLSGTIRATLEQINQNAITVGAPDCVAWRLHARAGLHSFAQELVVNLAVDNPRFDRQRFMKACGWEET